jgi:hypothetical protein
MRWLFDAIDAGLWLFGVQVSFPPKAYSHFRLLLSIPYNDLFKNQQRDQLKFKRKDIY